MIGVWKHRFVRRAAVASGFGLLLAFVPAPGVVFGPVASATVGDLPDVRPVTPAELADITASADEPVDGLSVVAEVPLTDEFTAVGVQFPELPDAPVFARVREADGRYGDWRELHVEDDGPDPASAEARTASGRVATEPLVAVGATGYQIGLAPGDASGAEVVTVREELQRSVTDATPLAESAAAPPFTINSRATWGARPARAVNYGTSVKLGVVHHSVSSNSYSAAQVPSIIRSIQAYHMDGNGWDDIGYNFVVDKFGGVWEGREGGITKPVIGAHARGFNTNSAGVVVLGDYTSIQASAAAIEGVSKTLGWRLAIDGVDPSTRVGFVSGGSDKYPAGTVVDLPRIVGHQDTSSTACPGRIEEQLGTIRSRALAWAALVPGVSPRGALEYWAVQGDNVVVKGWAVDDDVTAPISVLVIVNGRWTVLPADKPYTDWKLRFPKLGQNHAYDGVALATPGRNDVCVVAMNIGGGQSQIIGCATVVK